MRKIVIYLILAVSVSFVSFANEVPEEFLEKLPFEAGNGNAEGIKNSYSKLITETKGKIKDELTNGLKKSASILLVCGICAVAGVFKKADEDYKGGKIVEIAGICLLLILTMADTKSIINESKNAIADIGVFSKVMFPLLAMWASCAGKSISAVGITGGAVAYTSVCCAVAENLIFVLIFAYILLKCAGVAGDNKIASGMADAMKNSVFFIVKICLMGISFYLTLSGCITSAADTAAVKAAKAAVSVLPGIGSAVAGVTESVIAGAGVIRNSIGVLGVIAVLFFALSPFVKLFINMVLFKVAGVIADAFTSDTLSQAITGISDGYSMALGMLAAASGGVIMSVAVSILVLGG
ncbi:MAG: hypothetical protein E7432_02505 [Ruminococcaceae bacterium]|nr:hypothetical protein [Oscillospiraceae bacterium]